MKLGIFGGTFNPIHSGHLLLAEMACDVLKLDRVLFIPTGTPPHKHVKGLLSGATRLKMVRLGIKGNPKFAASDIEIKRVGVSYTFDTIKVLKKKYAKARLYLIVGADMLTVRWKYWDAITRECSVVAARRPSMQRRSKKRIRWITMPQCDIASSQIQLRLREGKSIRYLVPEPVRSYISRNRLYRVRKTT